MFGVDLSGSVTASSVDVTGDLQLDSVLSSAGGTTTILGNLDVQDVLAKDLDVANIVSQSVSADTVAIDTSLNISTVGFTYDV